jgi:anti-anti-sigma regulatory factor
VLRITVVDSSGVVVRLRVEGRLTGPSVEELRQACDLHALGEDVRLILDLADVSFADARGIETLKDLKRHNVTLLKPVPFIALQLRRP